MYLERLQMICESTKNLRTLQVMKIATFWSGKRDSNPRPLPWQGNALPAELFPHADHDKVRPLTSLNIA